MLNFLFNIGHIGTDAIKIGLHTIKVLPSRSALFSRAFNRCFFSTKLCDNGLELFFFLGNGNALLFMRGFKLTPAQHQQLAFLGALFRF